MNTHTLPRENCTNYYLHHPHDWAHHQVEGGNYYHFYHCPGIKEITIVTWEDKTRENYSRQDRPWESEYTEL